MSTLCFPFFFCHSHEKGNTWNVDEIQKSSTFKYCHTERFVLSTYLPPIIMPFFCLVSYCTSSVLSSVTCFGQSNNNFCDCNSASVAPRQHSCASSHPNGAPATKHIIVTILRQTPMIYMHTIAGAITRSRGLARWSQRFIRLLHYLRYWWRDWHYWWVCTSC